MYLKVEYVIAWFSNFSTIHMKYIFYFYKETNTCTLIGGCNISQYELSIFCVGYTYAQYLSRLHGEKITLCPDFQNEPG